VKKYTFNKTYHNETEHTANIHSRLRFRLYKPQNKCWN